MKLCSPFTHASYTKNTTNTSIDASEQSAFNEANEWRNVRTSQRATRTKRSETEQSEANETFYLLKIIEVHIYRLNCSVTMRSHISIMLESSGSAAASRRLSFFMLTVAFHSSLALTSETFCARSKNNWNLISLNCFPSDDAVADCIGCERINRQKKTSGIFFFVIVYREYNVRAHPMHVSRHSLFSLRAIFAHSIVWRHRITLMFHSNVSVVLLCLLLRPFSMPTQHRLSRIAVASQIINSNLKPNTIIHCFACSSNVRVCDDWNKNNERTTVWKVRRKAIRRYETCLRQRQWYRHENTLLNIWLYLVVIFLGSLVEYETIEQKTTWNELVRLIAMKFKKSD